MTTKQRNDITLLVRHCDVIDTGATLTARFQGSRFERLADTPWLQIRDVIVLRYRRLIVAVAGDREGRVGQREDHSTMTNAMSVGMVCLHTQLAPGIACRYVAQSDAEPPAGTVIVQ